MTGRLVALILGLIVALPAAAQDQQPEWDDSYYPFAREGFYMGFGAQFALENFDKDPPVEVPGVDSDITADDGGGISLRAGYRVHPRIAAEVLFQYYWGFEVRDRAGALPGVNDKFDGWTLTANAKIYPLLGRIQPYAVAGMGGIVFKEKKGDDSGFVARMGGGFDVYITDRFVLDLEIAYLFPGGSISELQFATFAAGLQYRY
jgi:opacity protein-like surface antigen